MIMDDTLREGMQAPGLAFSLNEREKLAELLHNSGIKKAMVSYPAAHKSEIESTELIIKKHYFDEVYALGRTLKSDIDLIDSTGANISLHLPFHIDNMKNIGDNIKYASEKNKKLEVALVDIDQYSIDELIKIAGIIDSSGADVIQIPDTKGITNPENYGKIISDIKNSVKAEIEIHCHNDYGYSIANAIEGIKSGADYVDTTIFGIGERNGISDSMVISNFLNMHNIEKIDVHNLMKAYNYLFELIISKAGINFFVNNYPFYGKNSAVHTAGTHVSFNEIFKGNDYSVNVYTGKSMVRKILENNGIKVDEDKLINIVNKIKDISADTGLTVKVDEIIKIAGEYQ